MPPAHKVYRTAAASIRCGWIQSEWYNDDGDVCLIQAVMDELGIEHGALPMKYQLQIDSQLALLSSYCTTKRLRKTRNRRLRLGHSLEKLIFGWNDSEGRTKEEVAEVLEALADRLEAEYTSYIHDIIRRAVRVPRQWSSRVMDDELAETR